MGINAISDARTAPVTEDLTTESLSRAIVRGNETMHRVDKKLADGISLLAGEWGVLKDDQTVERASATPVPNTFLVFAGNDRFDAAATGQVTLIMNSNIVVRTNKFDTGVTLVVGDPLTVKDRGAGESDLTKASGAEPVLGRVLELSDGVLVYESVRS